MNSVKIKTKRKASTLTYLDGCFALSVAEELDFVGHLSLWCISSSTVAYAKYDAHDNIVVVVGDISHWNKQPFTYDRKSTGKEYSYGE